jgi:hypothetical protein
MISKTLDDQYSEKETARRRDAVIKKMLNTPPKPHSEMKLRRSKSKTAPAKPARAKAK